MREVRLPHYRLVGWANEQQGADDEDVDDFRPVEHVDEPGIDPEQDAVWLTHRDDLLHAAALLRSLYELSGSEREELRMTMERIGHSIGLNGPWRVFGTQAGTARLSYISWWEDNGPDEADVYLRHEIPDVFRGGLTLINGLPEARYLGRLIRTLADVQAGLPWREGGVQD